MSGRLTLEVVGWTLWEIRVEAHVALAKFFDAEIEDLKFTISEGHEYIHCDHPEVHAEMVIDAKPRDPKRFSPNKGYPADVHVTW